MLSSVFHIFNKKVDVDYLNIWNIGKRYSVAGSGFGVIINDRNYILTNAHVIENSNFIECVKYNSDKRFIFEIKDIALEIDLALLEINTDNYDEFWQGVPINKIINPCIRGEIVKVVGFPQNGNNPSITQGVISRIIPILYNKSVLNLAIQVDSAINPGNSGGPVFNNNTEIIGMAFSHNSKGQNICYIIPSFIILHYLESIIKFKTFPGVCDLGIDVVSLENETIKEYYSSNTPGILINRVNPIGSTGHFLEAGDIINKIDDITINNDQTIFMENYKIVSKADKNTEKIPYWQILRTKHPGDKTRLTITRNKKEKLIQFEINISSRKLIPSLSKDISNKYYIFGGLIFISLNIWYLYENESVNPQKYNLLKYTDEYAEKKTDEIVILSDILQSKLTIGYKLENIRLYKINDIDIKNLIQVYTICESLTDKFVKFEFENSKIIILESEKAKSISETITKQYLKINYHNYAYI